ncbi:MAG: PQQ-binding-like beta-propeller repeat protein [Bacteroidales bacterium]|nr:PQQ-binding-like beta-propeller repeat protein [Bacteroidales bacterium]
MMKRLIALLAICTLFSEGFSQVPTSWRGPGRDGHYPENGLLKKWPAGGPEILWSYEQLGQGHSSAIVDQGYVFTTGMISEEGYLFKFDLNGKLVYKKKYGPEFTESFYGTRGTPTIMGDKIYLLSGHGKLYCFENETGDILWSKDLIKDFGGTNIQWGMNETPVIDGEIIYIIPGGKKNNLVALNRQTGETVWSTPGTGELTAYCTPLLFEHHGRKMLATHFESHLVGFDAATGEMLWKQHQPNEWSVHSNTPIYQDGRLFYLSGYGQGGGMLELSRDGNSVKKVWSHTRMDSRMGGAVLVDGYIYGSGDSRVWSCLDWESGEEKYTSGEIGIGAVIYADGMLYCYTQKGELALVKPNPSGFQVVSMTKVAKGSEQHWAHPVIYDGILYVRHGRALVAYKVK